MQRLDARVKLFIMVIITTLSVLSIDLGYLIIAFGITICLCVAFKVNLLSAYKRLKGLIGVVVFIAIAQSLTVRTGKPLIHIGSVVILRSTGLIQGGEFLIRMAILMGGGLIASTSTHSQMLDGMLKLRLPYKLVFMANIAIRYIPVFREEFAIRLQAINIRGVDTGKLSLLAKIKLYAYLITPCVSGSMVKSRFLARALSARAFGAYPTRTMLKNPKLTLWDYVVIILSMAVCAVFLFFMYAYGGFI